jgi:UrcA family protein
MFQSACRFPILPFAVAAALVAGAATAASAQPYYPQAPNGYYPAPPAPGYNPDANESQYQNGPETVIVTAPRYQAETTPLNAPPESVWLSEPVNYTVADLVNPERTQELRWKVWNAAKEVCERLAAAYPVYPMTSARRCFPAAYHDAMARLDGQIAGARLAYWNGY